MINPRNIPGLQLWLDANDVSTINDGKVDYLGNNLRWLYAPKNTVSKIIDKVGGYVFTNSAGLTGPSYEFGAINGKNAIHFNYLAKAFQKGHSNQYLSHPQSFGVNLFAPTFSIGERALVGLNVTPFSTGTYSLYFVFKPNDVRSTFPLSATFGSDLWAMTVWNQSIVSSVSSTASLLSLYPDRGLKATSYSNLNISGFFVGNQTRAANNGSIVYHETENNNPTLTTRLSDDFSDSFPRLNRNKNKFYQYGKVSISIIRSSSDVKKHTLIRPDKTLVDNFIPRTNTKLSKTIDVNQPVVVLGGFWPTNDGVGLRIERFDSQLLSPFEGFFCEMLLFDRVLSDKESNSIENYLTSKWFDYTEPDIPRENLIFCLDPSDKNFYPGTGSKVYDVSDSRLVGTVSMLGSKLRFETDYLGVISLTFSSLSPPASPNGQLYFPYDDRLNFISTEGWTYHLWYMPRYSDGEFFNRGNTNIFSNVGSTSSFYPNERGIGQINLMGNQTSGSYIAGFQWALTKSMNAPYHPVTNVGTWSMGAITSSGTWGANFVIPLKNYQWQLFTIKVDRPSGLTNFNVTPAAFYYNGLMIGNNFGSFNKSQSSELTGPWARSLQIGNMLDIKQFPTKGFIGSLAMYDRPMSDQEVLEYFTRTKGRFGL